MAQTGPIPIAIPAAFAFLLTVLGAAPAADLYVAPDGSDAAQCASASPCATIARACAVANTSSDRVINILMAPGTYRGGGCRAVYHHVVGVFGDCNSPADIVLDGNDFAFFAQDHAILTVQCIEVRSLGNGSVGFGARQFAIVDVNHVKLGPLAHGVGMNAQEISKINCAAPLEIAGNMESVVVVGDKSTVSLNCAVTFTGAPSFHAFVSVYQGGLLNAKYATYSGAMFARKYVCNNSEIIGAAAIPGSEQIEANCLTY